MHGQSDIKQLTRRVLHSFGYTISRVPESDIDLETIHAAFSEFTMISKDLYIDNLSVAKAVHDIDGAVVECGVWRGGMIAGLARILGPNRMYHLFDSFQGLPEAKTIDGEKAVRWQKDVEAPDYFDNCSVPADFARQAMDRAGVPYALHEGWFDQTVPAFAQQHKDKVALLRLDGDWYESTWCCLEHLFPLVCQQGVVIIDDYYYWDGCSRAVHDYLSKTQSVSRVFTSPHGVAYIVKQDV